MTRPNESLNRFFSQLGKLVWVFVATTLLPLLLGLTQESPIILGQRNTSAPTGCAESRSWLLRAWEIHPA